MAKISIAFTTLILLTFGASGVSMIKCACSGETSLLTLNTDRCCPSESDCMSVTTVQLSDSALPDHVDAPELMPITAATATPYTPGFVPHAPLSAHRFSLPHGYPPPRPSLTTVLQV